jgi:hypothetical protein
MPAVAISWNDYKVNVICGGQWLQQSGRKLHPGIEGLSPAATEDAEREKIAKMKFIRSL